MTDNNQFSVPNISIAGAPTIEWKFEGDVGTAECHGATLRAESIDDTKADLTLRDETGEVLAEVVVRRMPRDESITVSVMNIGSALMWSHIRWLDARAAADPFARADPVDCRHEHTQRGKDSPRRYGSWRTEVCEACGAFRTMTHHGERVSAWRPASEYDDETSDAGLDE